MQVMTEKCVGVERSRPTKGRSLVSNDCTEQEAAGRSGPIGPATTAGADAGDGGQPPIGVRARETRHAKLAPVSETYRARLALTAWLTAAAVGCGIPLEPAAPENIELKVEPDHVTIAWEKPPSWLQLRRYEWRALTGGAADKRLACPEAGDEDFCYLRPMRDPRIELPRPAGAEVTVEVRAVYQRIQAHTGEFSPPRFSTTQQVKGGSKLPPTTPQWHSTRGIARPGAWPIPTYPERSGRSDRNDAARHFPGE